jgi:hypothetical protein
LIDPLRQLFDQRRLFGDESLEPFDLLVLCVHADKYRDWAPPRKTTSEGVVSFAAKS